MSNPTRALAMSLFRNRAFRRHLPASIGARPIWVSPGARLRFLKPGNGAFDEGVLSRADRYVAPGMTVMDIGANIGEFALAAAHLIGEPGRVLAVEPDPFLGNLLLRTFHEPGNRDLQISLLTSAIGAAAGLADFNIAEAGRASNSMNVNPGMGGVHQRYMVPVTTIDAIVEKWREPDLIKVDVQGVELDLLKGAEDTISSFRPTFILEVSNLKTAPDVLSLFARHDYKLLDPATGSDLGSVLYNVLAVPQAQTRRGVAGGRMVTG